MSEEDVALYMADPDFAVSLGIEPPRCERCGGVIKLPPAGWNGGPLVHLIGNACEWVREGYTNETRRKASEVGA